LWIEQSRSKTVRVRIRVRVKPSLDGAVTIEEMHDIPLCVAEDLDLHLELG